MRGGVAGLHKRIGDIDAIFCPDGERVNHVDAVLTVLMALLVEFVDGYDGLVACYIVEYCLSQKVSQIIMDNGKRGKGSILEEK